MLAWPCEVRKNNLGKIIYSLGLTCGIHDLSIWCQYVNAGLTVLFTLELGIALSLSL